MRVIGKGYEYDDLILVPRCGEYFNSRDDVILDMNLGLFFFTNDPRKNTYPIMSSPMKGISGVELVSALSDLGCYGILHRFDSDETRLEKINTLIDRGAYFGVAVGARNIEKEIELLQSVDTGKLFICLDTANGYSERTINAIHKLSSKFISVPLVVGNVATADGFHRISDLYKSVMVRVGIGPGRVCITRNKTGVGVPQLTAIADCAEASNIVSKSRYNSIINNSTVIADGGIKNSGDAVKAFAAGARMVMLGYLFAKTQEAESTDGSMYGMASKRIQLEFTDKVKSIEGMEIKINPDEKVPVKEFIDDFIYSIKSACTYVGCKNLSDISSVARFMESGKGSFKEL
jgi:IMP dehydrogenase